MFVHTMLSTTSCYQQQQQQNCCFSKKKKKRGSYTQWCDTVKWTLI